MGEKKRFAVEQIGKGKKKGGEWGKKIKVVGGIISCKFCKKKN